MPDLPLYMTTHQVQRTLCISRDMVYTYIRLGILHPVRWTERGHYRIPREDVEKLIAQARRSAELQQAQTTGKEDPRAC